MIHLNKNSLDFNFHNKNIILEGVENGDVYLYFKHRKRADEWIIVIKKGEDKDNIPYNMYKVKSTSSEEDQYSNRNRIKSGDINRWNFFSHDVFLLNKKESEEWNKKIICIELELNGKR